LQYLNIICAESTDIHVFSGENDALYSLDYIPGLGLQSAISGAGLHASVIKLRHLFVEYSKINGYRHAWISYAISVSGNQSFLMKLDDLAFKKKIIIFYKKKIKDYKKS